MKWYLAKVVYRIICGDGNHTAQFDEQWRLIEAVDESAAFEKATSIGQSEAETFYNQRQQVVAWQFVNVPELHCLQPLLHGAEVHSRITEVDDAEGYINFIHHKAQSLQQKSTQPLLNLF